MKNANSNIAIFDTFKTSTKYTGEAKRQRGIISHLATEQNPELKTRTSIAHAIAKHNGILWQNIYSGIFRDLDEVLIPAEVVKEGGRLPLRRGPKALQLEGVPYYELTVTGMLVASSIEELGENRAKMLESYFSLIQTTDQKGSIMREGILLLLKLAPSFVFKLVGEYIRAYSTGSIDCIVLTDPQNVRSVISKEIVPERELVEAIITLESEHQKVILKDFFKVIS